MATPDRKRTASPAATPIAATPTPYDGQSLVLWLVIFANSLFLIWQCLDRYLAPRFLFLSVALIVALFVLRGDLFKRADWRFRTFDGLMLGWYGLNLASAFAAFSWSEGIFFAQKTLLLFTVYWLFRQLFHMDAPLVRKKMATVVIALTWVVCLLILGQIYFAFSESGLDNETLYKYASGVFGNKGLASDFLFFLLVLHIFLAKEINSFRISVLNIIVLLGLILLLQTRTVYVSVAASTLLYGLGRGILDASFRPILLRRWLPIGIGAIGLLVALALVGGKGSSLSERLNPFTYGESASANERKFVWYKTNLLNEDHFWWGVGNGSWKFWLPSKTLQGAFRLQEKGIVFTRTHNDYLEIRAEMGMIGVTYFILLFVLAALALLWALQKHRDKTHEILAISAGLLGYCIIQYFDFPRERIEMQVILALFFALSAYYGAGFWSKMPSIVLPESVKAPLGGLLVLGLMFNTMIGWYRVTGEMHNVKMAIAYQKQDYNTVLREAQAAKNMFLEYNDVAIPFEWYEGTAAYKLKRPEQEAIQKYEAALQLNPWSFQVLNNYATALASAKKFEEAIPYFEKATYINPKYDEGKFNLAYSYTQLGNYDKALDWLSKVDTIANPKTKEEVKKNKAILDNKANFTNAIREKKGN